MPSPTVSSSSPLPQQYKYTYTYLYVAYLVELFPFAQRARGITIFQFFGRGATFFTTFVNPIGLETIQWRYLITYCAFLAFEVVFIYFMFPETGGRTLEELAFLFEKDERIEATEKTVAVERKLFGEERNGSEISGKNGARATEVVV